MTRCPYLEEHWLDRRGPLRVYHYDCHVDHRSKKKVTLRASPPICMRNFQDCSLYKQERGREDQIISRYTD